MPKSQCNDDELEVYQDLVTRTPDEVRQIAQDFRVAAQSDKSSRPVNASRLIGFRRKFGPYEWHQPPSWSESESDEPESPTNPDSAAAPTVPASKARRSDVDDHAHDVKELRAYRKSLLAKFRARGKWMLSTSDYRALSKALPERAPSQRTRSYLAHQRDRLARLAKRCAALRPPKTRMLPRSRGSAADDNASDDNVNQATMELSDADTSANEADFTEPSHSDEDKTAVEELLECPTCQQTTRVQHEIVCESQLQPHRPQGRPAT